MTKPHKLGVYLCPGHKRPTDLDYIRHLQPSVVRILEPDPDDIRQVWAVAPNATIFPRYWWLDDGNRQQHAAMVADPVGTAHRHAKEWRVQLQKLGVLGNPKVVVTGVNEPSVNDANVRRATVEYTKAFMLDLAGSKIRAGALCLPVGHPAPLHNGEPDWRDYLSLEPIIKQTNGVLVLHEYWQQEGPNKPEDWGWLAGRHIKCPMQVPILIGESGIDGGIYGRYPNNVGYRGVSPPVPTNIYSEQIVWYHNHVDPRVIGICIYLSDYRDNHWSSFDLEPAYGDVLARLPLLVSAPSSPSKPPTKPVEPSLPPAGSSTLSHPLPGATITQHMYQNPDAYAHFGLPGHNGTDFGGVPEGVPVCALADGEVAYVDSDPDYGEYVRIYHAALGAYSFYSHLMVRSPLKRGDAVQAGMPIGQVGSTGNSTGPHLHLEIRICTDDTNYDANAPMPRGRVDAETWCALHGLKL